MSAPSVPGRAQKFTHSIYDDMRYSDQPFWIIWAVCELIKETGDLSILDTEIEWQDGGKASVLEHVKAAVNQQFLIKGAWFGEDLFRRLE